MQIGLSREHPICRKGLSPVGSGRFALVCHLCMICTHWACVAFEPMPYPASTAPPCLPSVLLHVDNGRVAINQRCAMFDRLQAVGTLCGHTAGGLATCGSMAGGSHSCAVGHGCAVPYTPPKELHPFGIPSVGLGGVLQPRCLLRQRQRRIIADLLAQRGRHHLACSQRPGQAFTRHHHMHGRRQQIRTPRIHRPQHDAIRV